jgi:D-threo-aldose 1-dehydrogenase
METTFVFPDVGFGTAALGDVHGNYSSTNSPSDHVAVVREMLRYRPCVLDTSRNYGDGRSEAAVGLAIEQMGGLPAEAYLSTKVDRNENNHIGKERVRQSLRTSLDTLRVDRVDVLFLHDPEYVSCVNRETVLNDAMEELRSVRDAGLSRFIGIASGDVALIERLLEGGDIDVILVHNRFTLINRQAQNLFQLCQSRGIRVFNAAPFAGGALAKGSNAQRYVYQSVRPDIAQQIAEVESLGARYSVPVGALALQFSLRSPLVDSTVVGASSVQQVRAIQDWLAVRVPEECWAELNSLVAFSTQDPEAQRWG